MIKILIIDDELLVRMGMKSIIEWQKYGYLIVGEAGNGLQGLERIRDLNPDIVLVDLMMPQMDGIEVIKRARQQGYKGKFVILTCVSEFEYLQQAIRLGVSDYILKSSVSPQDILAAVNGIAGEIEKNRISLENFPKSYGEEESFVLHEFLNLVFKGIIQSPQDIGDKLAAFGYSSKKNLYLQICVGKRLEEEAAGELYKAAAIGKSILDEGYWGSSFVNYEGYLVLLFSCCSMKETEEIVFRIQESAKLYFDLELTAAVRKIDDNIYDIEQKYNEMKEELVGDFFGESQEKKMEDWISHAEYASYRQLSAALGLIYDMVAQSRVLTVAEAKKLYIGAVEYVMSLFDLEDNEVQKTETMEKTVLEELKEVQSFEILHGTTLEILKRCYELAENKGYPRYEDELLDKMIQFIYENCNTRISTRDVAEHIHFSVDYTCKYFKKKTQTNLTDYILRLKVYRSRKELLEGMSMAEIADNYGFSSDGHYVKVFKKYEGITPGAFVKRNKKNEL